MNGQYSKLFTLLITNDDGIHAPGIRALVEAVKDFGRVVVVAPDKPQSGMGHAITVGRPIQIRKVEKWPGVESYQCSGTPVDCVKLAVAKILRKKPDICLSGINHGANHSINVIYSGTLSAALEASIEGIPSIGFSLLDYSMDADFSAAKNFIQPLVKYLLSKEVDRHFCLNVNIPAIPLAQIQGMKLCRQAYAKYEEDFEERRDESTGELSYWLTGEFVNFDSGSDTDVWALDNGYVSVVPVQFDLTNYPLEEKLKGELYLNAQEK